MIIFVMRVANGWNTSSNTTMLRFSDFEVREKLVLGGTGDDGLDGTDFNELLKGYGGDDVINAGGGNDVIRDIVGDNELYGDAGADVVHGSGKLYGGSGHDNLYGRGGDDRLYGGTGNDWLDGGAGNDWLDGGAGLADVAFFANVSQSITIDLEATEWVYAGGQWVKGGFGPKNWAQAWIDTNRNNRRDANDEYDYLRNIEDLTGFYGDDVLTGDYNVNYLHGGRGSDRLDGRGNADVLTGGEGSDKFVLTLDAGLRAADVIVDFRSGLLEQDKLELGLTTAQITTINAASGNAAKLTALKTALNIGWTSTSNITTNTGTNNSSDNDTAIYLLGADNALGGTGANLDELVMVLEDFDTALAFGSFTLIATDGV